MTGGTTTGRPVGRRVGHRRPGDRTLGAFLRAQRENLAPDAVGLPSTGRRRTPGLRREEVAALSGVGVSWYTWLERGRVAASRDVLAAICSALRLEADGRAHAMRLAGFQDEPAAAPTARPQEPNAAARDLVDGWSGGPAAYLDPALELLAWNAEHARWWGDPLGVPSDRRNLLWLLLAEPGYAERLHDPTGFPWLLRGQLRAHADRHPDHAGITAIRQRLASARGDLSPWWACRSVHELATARVHLLDAAGSPVSLAVHAVRPAARSDDLLLLMRPPA